MKLMGVIHIYGNVQQETKKPINDFDQFLPINDLFSTPDVTVGNKTNS